MTYTPIDPREQLIGKGSELLDALYDKHIWELTYPDMAQSMMKGRDATPEDIKTLSQAPHFVEALIARLTIDGNLKHLTHEYLMLRQTIEALDKPRVDLGGI